VQLALQRVSGEARTCALASEPPGEQDQAGEHEWWVGAASWPRHPWVQHMTSLTAALAVDQGLVQWLQELNVDSGTIQTVRGNALVAPDTHQPKTPLMPIFQLFSLSPSNAENLNTE